ncbi:LysR family transcriptional regulator [Aestuariibacter sp. AA17]|uniref:LysR family transcriptional regulator n=1 Tax=Fluctibacter corallii TaxID=2984329 RepID=A0ABT3A814_9ALTE|nr:LysR family transcriptional regulator [Aestuariibacter sp. AA17]MCV2884743.1 LysR family transcriptional regulator [Aestuariibacter sp. AA17]
MRPQDLTLLMIFDAIMTERSITRAANRLAMTQPAVSNAVSRMRSAWKDELFVKDGRNIQPTLYAQNLWSQIRDPILSLGDAIDNKEFNPSTARRTFRIAVSDILVDMVWVSMRKIIEEQAPGVNLHAVPYTIVNTESLLEDAEVDMVVGPSGHVSGTFRAEYAFCPDYVCVMRKGHRLAKEQISLEEFAAADHLLVSLSGDTAGYTDQVLMQHGLSRRIACTVNHFSTVPRLIQNSNLISVVPTTAVARPIINQELAATAVPLDLTPQPVCLIWHKRQDQDTGLIWLKKHVKQIVHDTIARQDVEIKSSLCQNNPAMCTKSSQEAELVPMK